MQNVARGSLEPPRAAARVRELETQLMAKSDAGDNSAHEKIEELSRRNADLEKQLKDSHPRAGQYPARMEDMPTTDQIPKVTD